MSLFEQLLDQACRDVEQGDGSVNAVSIFF